ncbi:hypothetical protein HanXRQr2_Chr16g0774261 [Helianthus annuus]|uniref:Uncharacterized protein n=1 Tax=Helianthus annuus TaxID=4232 RepID=A0A251S325_HELAN|nr:hypothetical protein HanXRQr2_Chr16g0774261 [Helianthus annuus]
MEHQTTRLQGNFWRAWFTRAAPWALAAAWDLRVHGNQGRKSHGVHRSRKIQRIKWVFSC